MPEQYYEVFATPCSPVVVRDGRPFGQGGTMKSLPWIYPSVFSGALRTTLGSVYEMNFQDESELTMLKQVATTGALPCLRSLNVLYLPKPFDCVVSESEEGKKKKRYAYAVRPQELTPGEGANLPCNGKLALTFLQKGDEAENFKPTKTAPFWSWTNFMNWLKTENVQGVPVDDVNYPQLKNEPDVQDALEAFQKDERTCIELNSTSGVSPEGSLFSTAGLDLFLKDVGESVSLFSKVTWDMDLPESALGALGGRRRLASWVFRNRGNGDENEGLALEAPEELKDAANSRREELEAANDRPRVRMVLISPAIFEKGWLPGWLDANLEGTPPGVVDQGVKLRLKSVAIDRWIPVSGWSYEQNAPKKVRRMVPAGGVYFFEVLAGSVSTLFTDAWFRSVCDDAQDARDGFGVALWGVY